MKRSLPAVLGATFFALAGFFWFPGHTWLQSDTLIYLPIFEHLWNPALLARDLVATRPHVTYTIYDEVTFALRHLTGLDFRLVLYFQQIVCRILAIWGIWRLAAACGIGERLAALVAGLFTLGAVIGGPTVLLFEYEPVPRGFAVCLILFAAGQAARGRPLACGLAGFAATLYHPPTMAPFWAVYVVWMAWRFRRPGAQRWPELRRALLPLLLSVVVLLGFAKFQFGEREAQNFFWKIDPVVEHAQRVRASYNWIDTWPPGAFVHYLLLLAAGVAAWWRLRRDTPPAVAWFAFGLPAAGVLSVPLTYLLLNGVKWGILPALQPARACLFIVAFAMAGGAIAGSAAARRGRTFEAFLWFLLALAPPFGFPVQNLLLDAFAGRPGVQRLGVFLLLAALAATAAHLVAAGRRLANPALVAALAAPFLLIPTWAGVENYPRTSHPEVDELSRWANASTDRNSIFLFPGFGRDLAASLFRAKARRAVYVDWKGGGQLNYLREFALEWWQRWNEADLKHVDGAHPERYRKMGINYLVVPAGRKVTGAQQVFENRRFTVYRLSAAHPAP